MQLEDDNKWRKTFIGIEKAHLSSEPIGSQLKTMETD